MKEKKRILLLTLGTGPLSATGEAGYRETQYVIEGKPYNKNGVPKKTNFVAEPIIDFFVPHEIFIIGTVRSVWHQLYASASTISNHDLSYIKDEAYQRLLQIEREGGIYTRREELIEYAKEITDIFSKIKTWDQYNEHYRNEKPNVHILLTKYGVNEKELIENYDVFKGIEEYLDAECEYEVAFDITHSFRSLPIYNLIIFNYIKNITRFQLSIKHIYYGNLDAGHELKGQAPIVDLGDLGHILDLTSGVAEFKDTGNSVLLLKMIHPDDPLKNELERFDLATQLNIFDKTKEQMINLSKLVISESADARYTGVREMIKTIFIEKFFENPEGILPEIDNISDADFKYMLTKWFFNQNRIGLGLATGLEALRDINTPVFVNAHNLNIDNERKYRESAESYFIAIAEKLLKRKNTGQQLSSLESAVCSLGCKLRQYKDVRNIFAHSLIGKGDISIEAVLENVELFKRDFASLKNEYDNNPAAYLRLFIPVKETQTSKAATSACRIVIDCSGTQALDLFKKSAKGKKYDVYRLTSKVQKYIFANVKKNNYPARDKADFILKYLSNNLPASYDQIQIILCNFDVETEIIFRIHLEYLVKEDSRVALFHMSSKGLTACGKIGLQIVPAKQDSDSIILMEEPMDCI